MKYVKDAGIKSISKVRRNREIRDFGDYYG